ncbi:MAG: thioredoxin domain-containing protein [Sphingobium sp.]
MTFFRLLLPALLMLIAAPSYAAPAKDWSPVTAQQADGSFLIGNPAAKTRLVEYVSYTCPHCAHFVAEGTQPLKAGWVARGRVVLEIRNLIRDRFDLTAALLARCGGAARFAGNHEAIFAAQQTWIEKAVAYEKQPSTLPADASHAQMMADIADKTGLTALMQQRGITPAQSHACLADEAAMNKMMTMTRKAVEQDGIKGTPSFILNGKLTEAHDWAGLRPLLPAPAN